MNDSQVNSGMAPTTNPDDTPTPAVATFNVNLDSLPDDPALREQVLREIVRQLLEVLHKTNEEKEALQVRVERLLRRFFGAKSEKYHPDQLLLFPELLNALETPKTSEQAAAATPPPPEETKTAKPKSKGHGRKKINDQLSRHEYTIDLTEDQKSCSCCGQAMTKIGEDRSERLDIMPAAAFVRVTVRPKYACSKCQEGVTMAKLPETSIPKGLPGPGLLAFVAAGKYCDHLPLYRQESILARYGIEVSRSTQCDWMAKVAELLTPLCQLMADRLRLSNVIWTDDTPILVRHARAPGTHQGRVRVWIGDYQNPYTVYRYTPTGSRDAPDGLLEFLNNWQGTLQADAASTYNVIYETGKIIEAGCNAHARRYFVDAKNADPVRAHTALAWYAQLAKIEQQAKKEARAAVEQARAAADAETTRSTSVEDSDAYFLKLAEIRLRRRQAESVKILDEFRKWLDAEKDKLLPKSLIGQAVAYALNHWEALCRFAADGDLDIDNNVSERAMRPLKIGAKNWLFFGHDNGGKTAAVIYSIIATCKRHNVDPFAYLRDVLERLPTHPKDRLEELLPDRWRPDPNSFYATLELKFEKRAAAAPVGAAPSST